MATDHKGLTWRFYSNNKRTLIIVKVGYYSVYVVWLLEELKTDATFLFVRFFEKGNDEKQSMHITFVYTV